MSTYTINRYGRNFRLEANDKWLAEHYEKGELQEHHMLDWIEANVPGGGVWVDVGCCNAQHALVFATKADFVLAFEPMPENHACCLRNTEANPALGSRVEVLLMGAGSKRGWASLRPGGTGQPSQWQLETKQDGDVLVVPLDAVLSSSDVRLIKIDVEGMERDVVAGAMAVIERCRPELFIEVWEEAHMREIEAKLAPFGYVLIERFNVVPTYHFSASGRFPVTYTPPK